MIDIYLYIYISIYLQDRHMQSFGAGINTSYNAVFWAGGDVSGATDRGRDVDGGCRPPTV